MLKIILKLIPTIILFFLYSCNSKQKEDNITKISISPWSGKDTDSVEFVLESFTVLEGNDKCMIGRPGQISIFESSIFVLDGKSEELYHFDNDGLFVNQIGHKGQGPAEYVSIRNFSIDRQNREIVIYDPLKVKLHRYRFDNEYLGSISVGVAPYCFEVYSDKYILHIGNDPIRTLNGKSLTHDILITNRQCDVESFYLPYKDGRPLELGNIVAGGKLMVDNNGDILYMQFPDLHIYSVSLDGVSPKYKIDFGSHYFTDEIDMSKYTYNNKGMHRFLFEDGPKSGKVYRYVFEELEKQALITYYLGNEPYLAIWDKERKTIVYNKNGKSFYSELGFVDRFCLISTGPDFMIIGIYPDDISGSKYENMVKSHNEDYIEQNLVIFNFKINYHEKT